MDTTEWNILHPPNRAESAKAQALRNLRRKLRSLSATTDLLHELMGFGHFVEMAMTRDGLLVGRPHRSVGFDAFIGSVTASMRIRTHRLWRELDEPECSLVLERLATQKIDPRRVGLPADPVKPPTLSISTQVQGT